MPSRVRPMTQGDLPAVGILAGKLVRMHHDFDRERFFLPSDLERGYQRWLGTKLDAEEVILLVADDPAMGVIGYSYAEMEPRNYNELLDACTKLHDIYVDELARKRGAGEALLEETFRRAAEKGAPRVVLLTASQNVAAQRLFARMGFRSTMIEMTRELGVVSPPRT